MIRVILLFLLSFNVYADVEFLKNMFEDVTINKKADKIHDYYHPEFLLYSNGQTMNFDEFLKIHQNIYEKDVQYKVSYDEATIINDKNKIALRMYITVIAENKPKELEVILIAEFKDGKIYRLYELTYPDWSNIETLN